MKRRTVLEGLAGAALLATAGCATAASNVRVRPSEPAWPDDASWSALGEEVGGRLERVASPNPAVEIAPQLFANPIWIGDQPALTQASGWVGAWTSAPSAYVVRARNAQDVAAAVRFAAKRGVRLVVKGGGHSYVGGSSAPDSLLVWTRDLQTIEMHDAFVPAGCSAPPVPAVSVGAGCIWGRVYDEVTTRHGRYVQGGGCTTVGVAGLVQGGGFGSFSKGYGLAAASLLEAEIVTADGKVRIVNAAREPDLFWALKGGGGGTFGVITRLTLKTHDLPALFGSAHIAVKASSDDAFRALLARFIAHYTTHLHNPHWGEQARTMTGNRFICDMVFQGLSQAEATAAWGDFVEFLKTEPASYQIVDPLSVAALPARRMWDKTFLSAFASDAITTDDRPGANPRDFWWKGDGGQAGAVWHGYESAWLPDALLAPGRQRELVDAWFEASRHWTVSFHFNKGLSGASTSTLAACRDTSINPQVMDAFALAIIASEGPSVYPQLPTPNLSDVPRRKQKIHDAMSALMKAAPGAGCYVSECDYFLENWQAACWGGNYDRLKRIKRTYDPDGLFTVHHGVGSEI